MNASAESIRRAGYSLLRGDRAWVERVIDRAIGEGTSIYHAHWLDAMDHLDDLPSCTICGGRMPSDTAPNPHWLCVKRQERGVPTPVMDYVPECYCGPCVQERGK